VVIVTGAAGGIGRVVTRAFLEHGVRVAAFDVAEVALSELSTELEAAGHGGRFLTHEVDVSDWRACEAAIAETLDTLGGLHVLVNNATLGMGVVRTDHMTNLVRIEELTPEVWDAFGGVNFSGAWYMTRFAAPHRREQGWGRVIDVTTSFFTMLRGSFHPYGPVKAAMEAMAAGHARELEGTGVTVNVVVPGGPADTAMIPEQSGLRRDDLIDPGVMAHPMLWLCTDAADAITGNRYVAARWDTSLPPAQAAAGCAAPIAWPELAQSPVGPGGRPDS
jgi:NAD(P)-dependent dehydrogenase (short-subunit alcohol dehydrogenase family)